MTASKKQYKTKCLEIEPPIVVLLTMWHAGAQIIKFNGRFWVIEL